MQTWKHRQPFRSTHHSCQKQLALRAQPKTYMCIIQDTLFSAKCILLSEPSGFPCKGHLWREDAFKKSVDCCMNLRESALNWSCRLNPGPYKTTAVPKCSCTLPVCLTNPTTGRLPCQSSASFFLFDLFWHLMFWYYNPVAKQQKKIKATFNNCMINWIVFVLYMHVTV